MNNGLSKERIQQVIEKHGANKANVLNILLDLQSVSKQGYIDKETAKIVAEQLDMTETRVYELLSYYAMLKTTPQAKFVLKICNSSPCHFSKADTIVDMLKVKLGVQMGQTTPDGMFAYHFIPCVGACEIGPVIKVKDTVFGNLTEEKIDSLLENLRTGEAVV